VHKVENRAAFDDAVADAFRYDRKVMIEEYISGRELECSVLGNDDPIASIPGEVVVHYDFYSYEAKYLDVDGARLVIPACVSKRIASDVRRLAIATFKTLACEGLGRVDFFLTSDEKLYVNEINTMPGFTSISMYPKLWEASGVTYTELVDRLIALAIERFRYESALKAAR
jgi:D-alanine-D-alanine ligase